jgi:hypothetical protein
MQINLDKLKKDINVDIKNLSDNFYIEVFFEELSSYCYAEKIAKIFYKILKMEEWCESEKRHYFILKNILRDNLKPINKVLYDNFMIFFKEKNEKKIKSLVESAEYYSLIRYKRIIEYVNDLKTIKAIKIIIKDEEQHIEKVNENNLQFKNYFIGYNNPNFYEKFKNELKVPYLEFRQVMLNTDFYKKLRGEIND